MEIRSWVAVAGAVAPVRGRTLAYEPIEPWIIGLVVSQFIGGYGRVRLSAGGYGVIAAVS